MKITDLRVNHIQGHPLGYRMDTPVFSWVTTESKGQKMTAAKITVALDEAMTDIAADTGWTENLNSLGQRVEMELKPRTGYYWTVSVRTDAAEEETSEVQYFETGKMDEGWTGRWITCDSTNPRHPIFGKAFEVKNAEIDKARLYISGLGLYTASINATAVTDERLTPYCNDYYSWVQYQTFDVTALLAENNQIDIMLGNGWYMGGFGFAGGPDEKFKFNKEWKVIADLVITYADGSEQVIATDDSWTVSRSKITDSSIYNGETLDDTLTVEADGFASYLSAEEAAKLNLEERVSIPVHVHEIIKPIELIHTPAGEQVFDLGQNMAGNFRLKVHVPKGKTVKVQVGEVLQEGNFYRDNLRSALAEYNYISDGEAHVLEPVFTFYGYRYAKVSGIEDLTIDDFEGLAYYSDVDPIGRMETGDAKLNQLISNIKWGQKGNFIDVPTDCPQRDERMGWTADTQVFVPTALYFTNAHAFYQKFLYDLRKDQARHDGKVPVVIPSCGEEGATSVWGDAATIIPWDLYLYCGDPRILEQSLDSMVDWVEYIRRVDGDNHGWRYVFHYGDWLALDNPAGGIDQVFGGTEEGYIADVYFLYSTELVVKSARILQNYLPEKAAAYKAVEEKYQALAEQIRADIMAEYFTATGRLAITTQTGYILALYYDLAPDRERCIKSLMKLLEAGGNKFKTGFVGTPLISRVLSAESQDEMAYKILHNEEFPGWLYEINLGATTVWERWNSLSPDGTVSSTGMNSFNHYAYGSIGEWMWQTMVGINPVETAPGFKKATIRPIPDKATGCVSGEYASPAGTYRVEWQVIGDSRVDLKVEVPFDCEATLLLPLAADTEKERLLMPGKYEISYRTEQPLA